MRMGEFNCRYIRNINNFHIKYQILAVWMAYFLTDPYYYLPKSYPFLNNEWTYPEKMSSHRYTRLGRSIETSAAIENLEFSSKIYEDSLNCERNLLQCQYSANHTPNALKLAEVQSSRRSKQQCFRKQSHRFPNFVQHRDLLEIYTQNSRRTLLSDQ